MTNNIQSTDENKPWHRYPLVWMMIFIPFTAVIMGGIMLWLAIDTDDGLVADDYYKQGLAINDVISLDKKAAELKLTANLKFNNSDKIVKLDFNKGQLENYPDVLQLSFQHATRANSDVIVKLDHGIDAQYIGRLKRTISAGIWYFKLSNEGETWKLSARTRVSSENSVQLKSSY